MSFKSELKKFGEFIKELAKKINVKLKRIFTSKKFKDSAEYVAKKIINIDDGSRKQLEKIVVENIITVEKTKLKGFQKASWVVKKTLKQIEKHIKLKLKGINVQDIMYLIGILVPQLFGKK